MYTSDYINFCFPSIPHPPCAPSAWDTYRQIFLALSGRGSLPAFPSPPLPFFGCNQTGKKRTENRAPQSRERVGVQLSGCTILPDHRSFSQFCSFCTDSNNLLSAHIVFVCFRNQDCTDSGLQLICCYRGFGKQVTLGFGVQIAKLLGRVQWYNVCFPPSPPPPLAQALPCLHTRSTGARLTVVFLVFSAHGLYGQKCNVTQLYCNCRGKGGLDHACSSSSCSYEHSACNCNPMLSALM